MDDDEEEEEEDDDTDDDYHHDYHDEFDNDDKNESSTHYHLDDDYYHDNNNEEKEEDQEDDDDNKNSSYKENVDRANKLAVVAGFMTREYLKIIIMSSSSLSSSLSSSYYWKEYLQILSWKEEKEEEEDLLLLQDHVLFWTDNQVEKYLKGSNIYDDVIKMKTQVNVAVENFQNILLLHPDYRIINQKEEQEEEELTTSQEEQEQESIIINPTTIEYLVKSAFVSLWTRAFEHEEENCVKCIPLLDMAQHSWTNANLHHETNATTGNVVVTASRDLQPDEELFFEYTSFEETSTNHDLARFFTMFGFLPHHPVLHNNNNEDEQQQQQQSIQELLQAKHSIFF